MIAFKSMAAGAAIAGTLGLAALGIGTGVANAAPPNNSSGYSLDHGYGPPGPRHDDWNRGRNWGPPPPPNYGYGGYDDYGPPRGCVSGPFGFLQFCN